MKLTTKKVLLSILLLAIVSSLYADYYEYSSEYGFYMHCNQGDAVRLPLIYPYDIWHSHRDFIEWGGNSEIKLFYSLQAPFMSISIKSHYIMFYNKEYIDIFHETINDGYQILDTEEKTTYRYLTKEDFEKALNEIGLTEYKFEPIKDIYLSYVKTGICYWFPDDVKKAITDIRQIIDAKDNNAEQLRTSLFNYKIKKELSRNERKDLFSISEKENPISNEIIIFLSNTLQEEEKSYYLNKAFSFLNKTKNEEIALSLLVLINNCDKGKLDKAKTIIFKKFKSDEIKKKIEDLK